MNRNDYDQDALLPSLQEVIKQHKLSAHKSLGQNFLCDMNLLRKIARSAYARPQEVFLEVGAGPGGLTRALLAEGVDQVVVIEKDPRCIPILEEIQSVYGKRIKIIQADALEICFDDLFDVPYRIATNLPYNISSDFIIRLLTQDHYPKKWVSAVMMLQKEFARRMCANVGTKDYGRLSVLCHLTCRTEILFDVHPANFTPAPKVMSAITKIIPNLNYPPCSLKLLSDMTRSAFGQRRKMIKSSLKQIHHDPQLLCDQAMISIDKRADHLTPSDYVKLCQAFTDQS